MIVKATAMRRMLAMARPQRFDGAIVHLSRRRVDRFN
jgi:hypothetical protein